MASDDERIGQLYELPPEDFVAARNALAEQLRESDQEAAAEVKRLRRPTVAAWALNTVVRRHPEQVEALRSAGERVRRAQEAAVGGTAGTTLRQADDERRAVVAELTARAVEEAGESHRDAIETTLDAASIDPEIGAPLTAGRLTKPQRRPSGLGSLGGPLGRAPRRRSGGTGRARSGVARLRRELDKVDEAAQRHRADLERAEGRLEDARAAVEQAQRRLDEDLARRAKISAELDESAAT